MTEQGNENGTLAPAQIAPSKETQAIPRQLVGAYALAPAISERPLPLMIDAAFLLVLAAVGFAALLFG